MRKWFTAFILIAAMLGGAVGAGAHEEEGACPMSKLPDCCKKARLASKSPEVFMARLCCNLNCSEPGSSGSNASSSFSPTQVVAPQAALITRVLSFNHFNLDHFASSPPNQNSSPKYIQHLALLI
jgi:hypothetical protein